MKLDEAIVHAQEIADKNCDQCAEDHQQLADWLKELKELRKLGWHPASEPPEYAEEVIILFKHGAYHDYPLIPMRFKYLGKWFMDVKWWCYPPKEK